MERAIQDIERKMQILQKAMDNTNNPQQKAMFASCLANAAQMVANFREVERILKSGDAPTKE